MASLTGWTWVWASSGRWWIRRKPGVLQSMGLQRVGHNWATELNFLYIPNWAEICPPLKSVCWLSFFLIESLNTRFFAYILGLKILRAPIRCPFSLLLFGFSSKSSPISYVACFPDVHHCSSLSEHLSSKQSKAAESVLPRTGPAPGQGRMRWNHFLVSLWSFSFKQRSL